MINASKIFSILEGVSEVLDDLLQSEDEGSSVCITNKGQKNTGPSASVLHLNRLEMRWTDFCADLVHIVKHKTFSKPSPTFYYRK